MKHLLPLTFMVTDLKKKKIKNLKYSEFETESEIFIRNAFQDWNHTRALNVNLNKSTAKTCNLNTPQQLSRINPASVFLSFTTVPVCTPPLGVDHPSARSELDLQGDKTNIRSYVQTGVCSCGGGSDSHRWGCLQSRWTRHCPAEYPQPGLNWVKRAAAGSGGSKRMTGQMSELGTRVKGRKV